MIYKEFSSLSPFSFVYSPAFLSVSTVLLCCFYSMSFLFYVVFFLRFDPRFKTGLIPGVFSGNKFIIYLKINTLLFAYNIK